MGLGHLVSPGGIFFSFLSSFFFRIEIRSVFSIISHSRQYILSLPPPGGWENRLGLGGEGGFFLFGRGGGWMEEVHD